MSAPDRPIEWDAREYDQQSAPHEEWQAQILERLQLEGDETVLDAGCGTGRLTKRLVERLPDGKVIGVDASSQMLAKAREHLGDDADLRQQDLTRLDLGDEKVDVVYSSAVFHWLQDHEALFRSLHGVMKPGAALEAQCGAEGNVAEVMRSLDALTGDERFAPYLRGTPSATNFASVGDTMSRLEQAGFSDLKVWTQEWPVKPADPRGYVSSVMLPGHLDRLPSELHQSFITAVLETSPRPLTVTYIRLNISARA